MRDSALTMNQPGTAATPTATVGVTVKGVGILGATGYAGQELIHLLAAHPCVRLLGLGSRQAAGQAVGEVLPWTAAGGAGLSESDPAAALPARLEDDATDPAAWKARGIDLVFSALPHGAFAARAAAFRAAGLIVVDLSADFRPGAAEEWSRRHGAPHPAPELIDEAVYGLTEWVDWPALTAGGRPWLVANPGCYATALLLAALPPAVAGWCGGAPLVVNALSGVSGAGRAPSLATHFVECGQGAAPYRVGETHPHRAEVLELLGRLGATAPGPLVFNPHLVPMARGIVASLALPLERTIDEAGAQALFAERYGGTPFVRLLAGPALPETRFVRGSNRCDVAVRVAAEGRMLLVFAAIDNLVKGAAGQAVQNMNRLMGWPETSGLPREGWPCA